jgi:hypothetical protein
MALVLGHRSARVADGHSITADKIRLMKCGETPRGDDEAPLCTAQLPNGRVTCVTTSQSFESQVLQKFRRQKTYTWQEEGESKKNKRGETFTTRPSERSRVRGTGTWREMWSSARRPQAVANEVETGTIYSHSMAANALGREGFSNQLESTQNPGKMR